MQNEASRTDFKVLMGMIVVLGVPFALTLMTIKEPRPLIAPVEANPTPYGYTWSLSLFIIPVLLLASWVSLRKHATIQKKAFWFSAAAITACGIALDVFFGLTFFTFENRQATLGKNFWGYSSEHGWQKEIPIEEIGFYSFGVLAVLLAYVWGDEFWFGTYNIDDGPRREIRLRDLASFHPGSAIFGVIVFGLGLLYKKCGPHPWHEGFPGYFLFLTAIAITPSILFFPVARRFINWRAFSFAFLFILFVSLFWEATIAVPYQWWGFQRRQMLGLLINGFCGLPVEEPILWVAVSWGTVIVYETVYTLLFIPRTKLEKARRAAGSV
jgi:hypothetical protein